MKPGDLVMWWDAKFGQHRFWKIEGVYLGCAGQESLVELRNLYEKPGVPGMTGNAETTFVPEPLIRDKIYSWRSPAPDARVRMGK